MTPSPRRLAGAFAVLAIMATACSSATSKGAPGGQSSGTTVATTTTIRGATTPAETDASTLRANMTGLLESQVLLTAVATSVQVSGGDPAPAVAAVDNNSQGLGSLVTSVFDASVGNGLHQLLAQEVTLLLSYAKAKVAAQPAPATATATAASATATTSAASATATTAATPATPTTLSPAAQVTASLDTWRGSVATLLSAKDLNLTSQSISDELKPDVQAQLDAIDAQVAKSTGQYDKVQAAAVAMQHTADFLAAGFAKAMADRYAGTTTGTAANLRAQMTAALVSNVYLTGIATATLLGGSDVAPVMATLDANTRSLANTFSANFGDASGAQFNSLWSGHIDALLSDARAGKASDSAAQASARSDLEAFPAKFAAFADRAIPKLTADQVSSLLNAHVQSLEALVDAQVAKSPTQFDLLRMAGDRMPALADPISEAIAVQFPLKYLP
jgi:hypothetical protein